jgi:hypothetical protein
MQTLAGCFGFGDNPPPAGDHTTVIPITTGSDSGMLVLLTVVIIIGFFIAVSMTAGIVWTITKWREERNRANWAENKMLQFIESHPVQVTPQLNGENLVPQLDRYGTTRYTRSSSTGE